jgi:hypothetical protein
MKPLVHKQQDGSMLIEWISKDCRFGLCLEKNKEENSWYYISRCKNELQEDGLLPFEIIDFIKDHYK